MTYQGYDEPELVTNRASLLLFGGTSSDRRAWAEEAHRAFEQEGPLREVQSGRDIDEVARLTRGVVYIADVSALSYDDQGKLVRVLQEREERPKFIVGLVDHPDSARASGLVREDLMYRLSQAQVDLSVERTRQAIRERRAKAEKLAEKLQAKLKEKAKVEAAKAKARAKAARPSKAARRPQPKRRPQQKARPAAAKRPKRAKR